MTDDDFKFVPAIEPEIGAFEYEIRVAFRLPMSAAQFLKRTAESHYDYTVRESAKAGPINGVYNISSYSNVGFPLTFRDADICTKALEQARPATLEEIAILDSTRAALVRLKGMISVRMEALYDQDRPGL